jgi:hypothetical protein
LIRVKRRTLARKDELVPITDHWVLMITGQALLRLAVCAGGVCEQDDH